MSHFTVAVIGEDHEEQLEPFYEGIEVDPYPEQLSIEPRDAANVNAALIKDGKAPGWDVLFACQDYLANKWGVEYEDAKHKIAEDVDAALKELPFDPFNITEDDYQTIVDTLNARYADDEYAEEYVVDDELGPSRMSTYNPQAKWDWYVVGGRWRGFYKVREDIPEQAFLGEPGVFGNEPPVDGKRADQLMAGSIDFESMRAKAAAEAELRYDAWQEVLNSPAITIEQLEETRPWSYFRQRAKEEQDYTLEEARADYQDQPVVKEAHRLYDEKHQQEPAYNALRPFFGCVVENFGFDRQDYVEKAKVQTAVPYALLHDGEWYEKGEMGWFGVSNDKMTDQEWAEFVHKTYDNLKPTTQITLVDAHI